MTSLLLRTVVAFTILAALTNASPPLGYAKQPDNDKNSPSYRYKYEIEDNKGNGHGKTETREGEHATGRYYVNIKQGSTDVKYIADEWGYQPFVKYGSFDDHSSASASLAFGEKAVRDINNENTAQSYPYLSRFEDKRKLVQLIQPYQNTQQSKEQSTIIHLNDSATSKIPSARVNYVTSSPLHQIVKTVPTASNEYGNDLTSTISEEDRSFSKNDGGFGQKVQIVHSASPYSVTTVTVTPASTFTNVYSSASSTRDGRYLHVKAQQKIGKPYLADVTPGLSAYSSTAFPPLDNSVTGNSIETDNSQHHENNGIFESTGYKTFSSSIGKISGILSTTPNPFFLNFASPSTLLSASNVPEATIYDKKENKFAKPIVVADMPKEKPFQYSTTFKCEDDDAPSTTPYPFALIKDPLSDTTSSHVLNSIQAGVSLLNAGEAHLIDNSVNIDGNSPAPVTEHVEDIPQSDQAVGQLSNAIAQQTNYEAQINPAFGGPQDTEKAQQQLQPKAKPKSDQAVDVQKSIEIHQSLPQQEIHYSEQPAVTQINRVNQHVREQQNIQLKNNIGANSKQVNIQTRGDIYTKVYELHDNYPKDSAANSQVYVVPPATYLIDDGSVSKNSLLQDKAFTYQQDDTRIDAKSQLNQQGNVEFDNIDILREQPKFVTPPGTILEKTIHVPLAYSVEKIIQKKIPYPVEKVVEKKIPVPQPYPVPVPQPFPVPVERIIEKKVPIPIHIPIPQPYPVEKPVHIPVPIEKIVEKPVHIPVPVEKVVEKKISVPQAYPVEVTKYVEKPFNIQFPYGVQYGVSYQQIMKPQNHGLYSPQVLAASNNLYNSDSNLINKEINVVNANNRNHNQSFQGYTYEKPAIPFVEGKENIENNQYLNTNAATKKISYNSYALPIYPISNYLLHRRHASVHHRLNKPERDDYVGPVPPPQHVQRQFGFQSKAFASHPTTVERTHGSRKARNHESPRFHKGNFRQSKVEYGFKPPLVPSVQYDEETASKVES